MTAKTLLTFDIHKCDDPEDIRHATEWLLQQQLPAIYFVPTDLLENEDFLVEIRHAMATGIEIGTHGHNHDEKEIFSLMRGDPQELDFLKKSKETYENLLGRSPTIFRSPHWCPLASNSYKTLVELGYRIDMSPTPQRIPLFSSLPFSSTWFFSPRSVHTNEHGLLVVPSSTFIFPLGMPTFSILGGLLSVLFLYALKLEASISKRKILNIMLHVGDLHPNAKPKPNPPKSFDMLLPKKYGGFGFKHLLRKDCPVALHKITVAIFKNLRTTNFCSSSHIHSISKS